MGRKKENQDSIYTICEVCGKSFSFKRRFPYEIRVCCSRKCSRKNRPDETELEWQDDSEVITMSTSNFGGQETRFVESLDN